MQRKIACFISGPYRYCDLVLEQLDRHFTKENLDFDVFIHLWSHDSSDKSRGGEININTIKNNEKVKALLIQDPLSEEECISEIKSITGKFSYSYPQYIGHSPVNNVIGMFKGINELYNYLKNKEILNDYSHILRMRTDISISKDALNINLDEDLVLVSNNPYIEKEKISDHTMLVPTKLFFNIWGWHDSFIKDFAASSYNPELYLGKKFKKMNIKYRSFLNRFSDYNVIYETPKSLDPRFIKNCKSKREVFERRLSKLE
ncbi:hypothetical protein K2B98_004065, partial [Vibrio parahaemolyticus]|nr:hypothetical protein [Vibrio parahaemolyticus]